MLFRSHKPNLGVITLWESGGQLHGGGDGAIGLCPGKREGVNDCEGIIPSSCITSYDVVCPQCRMAWKSSQVPNMYIARLNMHDWAEVIYKYFMKLGRNADIYLKYAPGDIQPATFKELAKPLEGDILRNVRQKRILRIYPIANIIKDTAAGADILKRFYAFLTA